MARWRMAISIRRPATLTSRFYGWFSPRWNILHPEGDALPSSISGLVWSQEIECAYFPKEALLCHGTYYPPVPWLGVDGHFALEPPGSEWTIQRWILREKGLVVAGPPLNPRIDPVTAEDLGAAVRGSLEE